MILELLPVLCNAAAMSALAAAGLGVCHGPISAKSDVITTSGRMLVSRSCCTATSRSWHDVYGTSGTLVFGSVIQVAVHGQVACRSVTSLQ